jgi:para-nitrobenzyl esterase
MESGDCSARPRAAALTAGAAFAEALGCADLACLRALPAAQLVEATPPFTSARVDTTLDVKHGLAGSLAWAASVDGWVVPADPMARLLAGQHNKVPLVIGSNAEEMALFLVASQTFTCGQFEADMQALFGADADDVVAAYPCALDGRGAEVAALTDLTMSCRARRVAHASAAAGAPTYRYSFEHTASYGPTVWLGAYHAAELSYVFGNFGALGYVPTLWERQLSDTMMDHWGQHAATGAPNGPDLVEWPRWTAADERWLELEVTAQPALDDKAGLCAMWAQIAGW